MIKNAGNINTSSDASLILQSTSMNIGNENYFVKLLQKGDSISINGGAIDLDEDAGIQLKTAGGSLERPVMVNITPNTTFKAGNGADSYNITLGKSMGITSSITIDSAYGLIFARLDEGKIINDSNLKKYVVVIGSSIQTKVLNGNGDYFKVQDGKVPGIIMWCMTS